MGGRLILKLPKYVSAFSDRHGKTRYRFRKSGLKTCFPKSNYPSQEFNDEFASWLHQETETDFIRATNKRGSIDELLTKYISSSSFQGNDTTKSKKRAILQKFCDKENEHHLRQGERPAATCPFYVVDKYVTERSIKRPDRSGGPEAANRARKVLLGMFRYAIKLGIRTDNPVEFVDPIPSNGEGFHCWSEEEIAQYQKKHSRGTTARLAFDLMLWTAKRPTDASQIRKSNIDGKYLIGTDGKTSKAWAISIAPDLQKSMDAMPLNNHDHMILSEHGEPFSPKGFGNKMADWCDAAGLSDRCRGHGLRKACMRRLAEAGATQQQLKAISLHSNDREVSTYVKKANQRKLAENGIDILAKNFSGNG